jgi:hypothetical protein
MNHVIKNNAPNAFNTPRLCMLTGDIKPLGQLKATPRETQLFASNKAQREKIVFAETSNHIHITTQAQSDESKRKAGRRIGV